MPGFASTLAISAAAARVASLDLCADEYLLSLAKPGEIASVSRLAHDPLDSVLWRAARRSPVNAGTIESLIRVKPDVLLAVGGGNASVRSLAGRLGMRLVSLPYPASPGDVAANMTETARLLGDPARATAWIARFKRLQRRVPVQQDSIFLSAGGLSVAEGSIGAQWMRLAGFRQRPLQGGRATIEQLAVRPPQVVLQSDYRRAQASLGERWLRHPLLRDASSRRIVTDGRPWTCAGPLMLGEIERLRSRR